MTARESNALRGVAECLAAHCGRKQPERFMADLETTTESSLSSELKSWVCKAYLVGPECNDWHRDELCIWHPGNLLPLQVPGISPTAWVLRSDTTSASPALPTLKTVIIPRKKPDGRRKGKRTIRNQPRTQ